MPNTTDIKNGLGFKLSTDGQLLAIVMPCDDKIDLDTSMVKERLQEEELSNLFVDDYLIFELVHRYNHTNTENFEVQIGGLRDATADIELSANKMKARLVLQPSFGGKVITLGDVENLLATKKIVFGIVPNEMIEAALLKNHPVDMVIAAGIESIPGIDSRFENLMPVDPRTERKPLVEEDGSVDYRELGEIFMVHADDVLMQRIPAVPGKNGQTVLGEDVQYDGGLDTPFSGDQRGVYVNPDDENQLLSAIVGQPILVPNGIVVSPILTVKSVDLASGNIRFEGSVVVLGNVEMGMKIYALEDITIQGGVTDAQLECRGNLFVKNSVIGNCELIVGGNVEVSGGIRGYQDIRTTFIDKPEEKPRPKKTHQTRIISQGSVLAGFAESFHVEASIDIVINKYAMNCHLMAANKIVIGGKGGKKSSIIGGVTWAMALVKAGVIGAESGIKTHVQAGSNPYIQRRHTELREGIIECQTKQKDIHKILEWMAGSPEKNHDETLARLHHTLTKLIAEEGTLQAEFNELLENMTVMENAKIIADRGVYVGTEIKINRARWSAEENRSRSVFTELRREIVINAR
ncbi:MAG: FapA family protein [Methylococcaceae bacterium]